jgi:hypothetical protein
MNFLSKKYKQYKRYKQYRQLIEDVALEISQSYPWRNIIFNSEYKQKFLIDSNTEIKIFKHIKKEIVENDFQFYVSKVKDCPEEFDPGCIIFRFESKEFPKIVRYSGNYINSHDIRMNE